MIAVLTDFDCKPQKGVRRDPKYTIEGWDHGLLYALRSEQARQETTTYLHELLGYLAHQGKPAEMLLATVDGEPVETVAEQWRCSIPNVKKHCTKLRSERTSVPKPS